LLWFTQHCFGSCMDHSLWIELLGIYCSLWILIVFVVFFFGVLWSKYWIDVFFNWDFGVLAGVMIVWCFVSMELLKIGVFQKPSLVGLCWFEGFDSILSEFRMSCNCGKVSPSVKDRARVKRRENPSKDHQKQSINRLFLHRCLLRTILILIDPLANHIWRTWDSIRPIWYFLSWAEFEEQQERLLPNNVLLMLAGARLL